MKPLILTNAAGQPVRVNPMNVIGWAPAKLQVRTADGGSAEMLGSAVALSDGPRQVRESAEQIDFLFERATDGWMRPPITRHDLERWLEEVRTREQSLDHGGEPGDAS